MTDIILTDYRITKNTFALLPAYHMDYDTIAWEQGQHYYIKKTALQLIKNACLEGGADYDGRKAAVTYKTGITTKVPIPIIPHEHIFAFPTHSPKLHQCRWLFYHHIQSIERAAEPTHTNITFKNGKELLVPVSYHTVERQLQRTSHCICRFSNQILHPL